MRLTDAEDTPLSGELRAHGTAEGIRIEALRLEAGQRGGASIEADGTVEDLFGSPRFDLRVNAGIPDPPAAGKMFGAAVPELPAVAVNGQIAGRVADMVFDGQAAVGESLRP